jgi:hypothetical protein
MNTTKRNFKTIAANPGWELVEFVSGCGLADELVYTPIIGWDIRFEWEDELEERVQMVSPITVVTNTERARYWMVKRPDGKFQAVDDASAVYEDEASALERLRFAFDRDHPPVKSVR